MTLFSRKKADLYNFRCPYCGDSQKRRNKARGYLFKIKNNFTYKCHNCGVGRSLANFLKDQDTHLYDQYIMEKFKEGSTGKGTATPNPKLIFSKPKFVKKDIDLEKISELNNSHPARVYLEQRGIKDLDYFYYCPKFKEWTNNRKRTFDTLRQDSPRIIIPFKDKDGNLFGYQGRSLAPKAKLRYITIMLDEDQPKIFGLDRVKTDEPIYIVEGPFDSIFIKNSVAMAGSDADIRTFGWSNHIWVFDNEPRNREIVARISKSIDRGDKVIIWPKNIQQKDINDMHLAGHDVQTLVESNVYQGLTATLKFNDWKKV
nr:DNA primase subunit [uncultured Mediterranean phage uvMED]BAR31314.1 DNA primase subunit [uncultured Mediterranean phage uvMED]